MENSDATRHTTDAAELARAAAEPAHALPTPPVEGTAAAVFRREITTDLEVHGGSVGDMRHVTALTESRVEAADEGAERLGLPDLGKVVATLKSGQPVEIVTARTEPHGPLNYGLSTALVARGAVSQPANQAETEHVFPSWVAVRRRMHYEEPDPEGGTTPTDIRGVTQTGEPFALSALAVPVPPQDAGALVRRLAREHRDLSDTPGHDVAATAMEERRADLARAAARVLTQEVVTVGAIDDVAAERIGERVARSVLPTDSRTSWEVVRDAAGNPVIHPSKEAAQLAELSSTAGTQARDSLIGPEKFIDTHVAFPSEHTRGLEHQHTENFRVTRGELPGGRSITLGNILSNDVNPDGSPIVSEPLRLTLDELGTHMGVFGASKSGKTEFLIQLAAATAAEGVKVIILDCNQAGNYDDLARRVPGLTVRKLSPGQGNDSSPLISVNPLAVVGNNTLAKQVRRTVDTLAAVLPNDDARRTYKKWLSRAVRLALSRAGHNLVASTPLYPYGRPPLPDDRAVIKALHADARDTKFSADTVGDVSGYTASQFQEDTAGALGDLMRGEGRVKIPEMLDTPGAVVIEVGNIIGPHRDGVATHLLYALYDELQARRTPGESSPLRVMFIVDESNIFSNTDTGAVNADVIRLSRQTGLSIVVGQQTTHDLHPGVLGNVNVVVTGRLGNDQDRETVERRLGDMPPGGGQFFIAPRPGRFLLMAEGMEGPVRIETTHPSQVSRTESGVLKDMRDLADFGLYRKPYEQDVSRQAREMLTERSVGANILGWAEKAVIAAAAKRPFPLLGSQSLARLRQYQGRSAELRDCMVDMAATASVAARFSALADSDVDPWEVGRKVVANIHAQIDGTPIPEIDLVKAPSLPAYHYAPVEDAIQESMLAGTAITTGRHIEVLGQPGGLTATEQLDSLAALEVDAINGIAHNIYNAATQSVTNGQTDEDFVASLPRRLPQLPATFAKLAGGSDEEHTQGVIQQVAQQFQGRDLTPREQLTIQWLAEAARPHVVDGISYATLREELQGRITDAANAPGIDMATWNDRYAEVGETTPFVNGTLAEQLADIQARAAARVAAKNNDEIGRRPVVDSDVFFARDHTLTTHDYLVDAVVAGRVRGGEAPSQIEQDLDRQMNQGRTPQHSFLQALQQKTGRERWERHVSDWIYDKDSPLNPGLTRLLAIGFESSRRALLDRQRQNSDQNASAGDADDLDVDN